MEYIILRFLALIGIAAIVLGIAVYKFLNDDMNRAKENKKPWNNEDWYLGDKPLKSNKKLRF